MIDGKKITKIREAKGLSRAALSRDTNIPIRTLENWEGGLCRASGTERINRLCDALDCDIAELYDDEILRDVRRMHEAAVMNTILSEDNGMEEIDLIQNIQGIYDTQGPAGLLKLMDRMIYHIGQDKALEIVKEYVNESN